MKVHELIAALKGLDQQLDVKIESIATSSDAHVIGFHYDEECNSVILEACSRSSFSLDDRV